MVAGQPEIVIDGNRAEVRDGVAVIPKDAPHEVRNTGGETLRFVAVYAAPHVTTTYEREVQPDGGKERESTA